MNTFLPLSGFVRSAHIIASSSPASHPLQRLTKQISECGQMHRVLIKMEQSFDAGLDGFHAYEGKYDDVPFGYRYIAWSKHPAVTMWYGHRRGLVAYAANCESVRRELDPSCRPHAELAKMHEELKQHPPKQGRHKVGALHLRTDKQLHRSHMAVLQAKAMRIPRSEYEHLYYWPGFSPELKAEYESLS